MSTSLYIIRNYRPADFDEFVRLNSEAEKLEPTGASISVQFIAENLRRPGYNPTQDLFIAETDKGIVGYLDVLPELAIGRVILKCWIQPTHRRRGLASKLFRHALKRAKEMGAGAAHVNLAPGNEIARNLLSGLGFIYVRRFLELRLDLSRLSQSEIDRTAGNYHHLNPDEVTTLTRIQNRSFAGSWGYNPNTVAEITYEINRSHHSPEEIILVSVGDEVAGYCWTMINGGDTGRIYMIGTDPDYRGQGTGRKVLMAGLAHLKNQGLRSVRLTVDSRNEVALNLYRSAGFEVETSRLWYQKILD